MEEIWKDVPNTDGIMASSWGRVWRKPFTRPIAISKNGAVRTYHTKPTYGVLTKASKTARHKYMGWMYEGKNYKVHRLVCAAFHGPPPFERAVVLHLDDDATNNRPENLRWGTQKENLNSPSFIAYCKSRTGENSPTTKSRRKLAST